MHGYLCDICALCPQELEEGNGSPRTGFTDGYKPQCRCWELNLDLLEQPLLLTAEPMF